MTDKELSTLIAERDEIIDCLEGVFYQACLMDDGKFDHLCLSAYESAQELLVKLGRIKESDCYRT